MDKIVRMIAKNAPIKAVAIEATGMVERARQIHDTWPVATAALGRLLMGASMMGNMIKTENGSVTLRVNGGGPLGTLTAVSDCEGNTRGFVHNPAVDVPRKAHAKLDVGAAVGDNGDLTVIRDVGMKEPYVGSVQLVGGEIAEDIAAYFVESEQIPTACALGVLIAPDQSVQVAGGYLILLLPGADDWVTTCIAAGIGEVGAVSTHLANGLSAQEILEKVLSDFEMEVLESTPVEYRCYCSEERVSRALISMGRAELESLIEDQGEAELTCQFCDRVYHYNREQLEELLRQATS
jgi:molecular chaperone Hsp33